MDEPRLPEVKLLREASHQAGMEAVNGSKATSSTLRAMSTSGRTTIVRAAKGGQGCLEPSSPVSQRSQGGGTRAA